MIGQGSPSLAFRRVVRRALAGAARLLVVIAGLLSTATDEARADVHLRLRFEWGGSLARRWQGTIQASEGTLNSPRALGVDADEPGSIWAESGQVFIRSPSRHSYDGVDVTVHAPSAAKITVHFASADQAADTTLNIPLADLLDEYRTYSLDNQGSKLVARRVPGDKLDVHVNRDNLVLALGERLEVDASPNLPALLPGTRMRIQARLLAQHGQRSVWTGEQDLELSLEQAGQRAHAHFSIPPPDQEGVFDLVLTATRRGLQERLPRRMTGAEERRLQFVVVSHDRPVAPPAQTGPMDVLVEIDPANSGWSERLASLTVIPALRRGPLGSGDLATIEHPLGTLASVGPHGREPDISWQAYPLPISRPGQPHILEVEYPADKPQFLGISIVEPNAAGAVLPIGLDSGAYVSDAGPKQPQMQKHRLVFWPRTSGPLLLVTNRREGTRAVYGRIRLLGPRTPLAARVREPGPHHLPRLGPIAASDGSRLLAAYYDRPLFPANFGANQALDPWNSAGGRTLADWSTFFEGGSRLLEYLDYAGYNALLLSVMADGSTIYPSKELEPTPRYDDGVLFANGQDPIRKDVLELMFQLCDRQSVQLVPAMHFASPLPELEALKRRGGGEARGLELIGPSGITWLEAHDPRQGLAPYYNPLNPRVQQAVLAAVRELAGRYASHPSFGGLALQLSADGYAQLPGAEWGCDDDTLVQFTREVDLDDAAGPPRELRDRLLTPGVRRHWLHWRAEKLADFYRRLQAEVSAARRGAKLYLLGADMLNRPELLATLKPNLDKPPQIDDALRCAGIEPALYRDAAGPALVRVSRIGPEHALGQQAAVLELNSSNELDQVAGAADLFYHEPQEARVASFDMRSPFHPSFTRLVTQALPAGRENCRRFAHALAQRDARLMADGGWLLSLGAEDAVRDFVLAYRELPPIAFQRVEGAVQPVIVRTATTASRTYVYLVNDSPWTVTTQLTIDAPAATRVAQTVNCDEPPPVKGNWNLTLKPYALAVGSFSSPGVRFSHPQTELPPAAVQSLDTRVQELWSRAATLKHPEPKAYLVNGDFEVPQAADGTLPGWMLSQRAGARIVVDEQSPQHAKHSLRLIAAGDGAELASVAFVPRPTGRLSVSAWVRGSSVEPRPAVRIAVQRLGPEQTSPRDQAPSEASAAYPLSENWTQQVFQVRDLPEGLSGLSVHFALDSPGEVWIDQVQVFDLEFNDNERIELSKLIALAEYKRTSGEVSDCLQILDGFWPRYLASYAPRPVVAVATRPAVPVPESADERTDEPAEPEHRPGMLDRVRRWMPDWWR